MAFIGKEPQFGAYSMLDNLTASATASYSLTLDSVAFVPESANHLLVSLNGVIQKAGSSFTVSGSTLTFSSTLASSDSIDFVLALGNVLDIGTPSDATVTNAKTNFVSTSSAAGLQIKGDGTTDGTLQLNCSQNSHGIKLKSPAHSTSSSYTLTFPGTDPSADKFLKTDGSGNLSFADASSDFVKVATSTLSSGTASVSLTGMDSTYKNFKILASDISLASSDNFYFRFINSSGDMTGSSYYGIMDGAYKPYNSSDAGLRASNYNTSNGRVSNFDMSTNATNSSAFEMYIPNPSNSATFPMAYGNVGNSGSNGTYMITNTFAFQYTSAGAITGIKFYTASGGNINTGSFQLFGIKA